MDVHVVSERSSGINSGFSSLSVLRSFPRRLSQFYHLVVTESSQTALYQPTLNVLRDSEDKADHSSAIRTSVSQPHILPESPSVRKAAGGLSANTPAKFC